MSGLLAAEVVPAFSHLFHHIAVAYCRLQSFQTMLFQFL